VKLFHLIPGDRAFDRISIAERARPIYPQSAPSDRITQDALPAAGAYF